MSRTILVVDDKANIRNLVREYLEAEGFRVLIAADGRDDRACRRRRGGGRPDRGDAHRRHPLPPPRRERGARTGGLPPVSARPAGLP